MEQIKLFNGAGNVAGIAGIILCAVAGLVRAFGGFYLVGFEAITVFQAGMALLLVAVLAKLQVLVARQSA